MCDHSNKRQPADRVFRIEKRAGFTLIEISIVLVVIGLVVGAVFVARDLIKAFEIRAQVSQIEEVNTAVNTFKLKYDCLPGDCIIATRFFGASSQPDQVSNGNGNRQITGYIYSGGGSSESTTDGASGWGNTTDWRAEFIRAWDHLAAAKLVASDTFDETDQAAQATPGLGIPKMKINSPGSDTVFPNQVYIQGGIVFGQEPAVSYNTGGHRIRLGYCLYNGGAVNASFGCGINPSEAAALDAKIDDGFPYTGKMVIMAGDPGNSRYIYRIPGGYTSDNTTYCGTYATNIYRRDSAVPNNLRDCAVSIKADF